MQIPYHRERYVVPDEQVPGNSVSTNPLVFHLEPAWGGDLARIKSILFAIGGVTGAADWGPDMQEAVTKAFEHGALGFVNTISKIDGLTVPAIAAKRAGLIAEVPMVEGQDGPTPDDFRPIPVLTGLAYSRICAADALLVITVGVAAQISSLSQQASVDPRFFVQPSGSGGPGTPSQSTTTADNARPTSRRRGTAGKGGRTGGPRPTA